MSVYAPLRLEHRETISPALLGRALCTEVAEQVPYWVAVLTPTESSLGTRRIDRRVDTAESTHVTTVTLVLPSTGHTARTQLLAALGVAASTWQSSRYRGTCAGILVDIDDANSVYPVRLPAVCIARLTDSRGAQHLLDDVSRRLASVPNQGRDYMLARAYPTLRTRAGAQILFRDSTTHDNTTRDNTIDDAPEATLDHTIEISVAPVSADGTVEARVRWSTGPLGGDAFHIDELVRLWSSALTALAHTN